MFINTHSHLYDEAFDDDREAVLQNALNNGIGMIIMPNDSLDTVEPMMRFYESHHDTTRVMMGLHPENVKEDYKKQLNVIEQHLENPCFVGVGEIGLDYYWDDTFKEQQVDALIVQLRWAKKLGKPVSLHVRKAFDDIFKVIDEEQDGTLQGVFHCFGGDENQAKRALNLGFYLGFGGVLTYKNSKLCHFFNELPLDRILLETDDPFLPPVPYRGQRNEPAYMIEVAKKIADLRGITVDEVERQTCDNARRLFAL